MRSLFPLLFVLLLLAPVPSAVQAQETLTDYESSTATDFPNALTFSLHAEAPTRIVEARVRYRVERLSCGKGTASGFADIKPSATVNASWRWDLRESGGLPAGAIVHYRWDLKAEDGRQFQTPEETIVLEDPSYQWRTLTGEHTVLHWYAGGEADARQLLAAADAGIHQLQGTTGVLPSQPVHVRVYASAEAFRDSLLFPQEWAGGVAHPAYGLVAIGIGEAGLEWGKRAMVHEMSHVVVAEATFTCGASLPSWLDEGLAMFNEGELEPPFRRALEDAVARDAVSTVRGLAGGFPYGQDEAILAYAQSYSLVEYLLETHGPERMSSLLRTFKERGAADRALRDVYGFDQAGLEHAWRAWIGLPARETPGSGATVVPLPIVPGFEIPATPTPTPLGGLQPPPTPPSSGGGGCNPGATAGNPFGAAAVTVLAVVGLAITRRAV